MASKANNKATEAQPTDAVNAQPKYPKPKILLIDVRANCANALTAAGYAVTTGSFGSNYRVNQSAEYKYVPLETASLPNCGEQEVVIVDLSPPTTTLLPTEEPGDGVQTFWQSAKHGVISPRQLMMRRARELLDKVFKHAGLFVVLAHQRQIDEYLYTAGRQYSGLDPHGERWQQSNWSFLSEMNDVEVENEHGYEVTFLTNNLSNLLRKGSESIEYHCSFNWPSYRNNECWIPLARNKYGKTVAALYAPKDRGQFLLILPQMPELHSILVELVQNVFAIWRPSLFPHVEGAKWVHRSEYELPRVIEIEKIIDRIESDAKEQVEKLRAEMSEARDTNRDWYTLLRGTGEELVHAVIRALRSLGFTQVVDVDCEQREKGNENNLREDIQIHDRSPVLVVDVKGVNGKPDDDESRQAEKHATMRIREWKRVDVQGLSIINHERHLPPRDRDQTAYRDEIIKNAQDTHLGLMTTWDLFKLMRNVEKLHWHCDVVLPIFYRVGRIDPVPQHYQPVGKVVGLWDKAFGIIPTSEVRVGDCLAVEDGESFVEIKVESLNVDDKTVEVALPSSNCGVAFANASKALRRNARVFKIAAASE